jgi:hypothetical protein
MLLSYLYFSQHQSRNILTEGVGNVFLLNTDTHHSKNYDITYIHISIQYVSDKRFPILVPQNFGVPLDVKSSSVKKREREKKDLYYILV